MSRTIRNVKRKDRDYKLEDKYQPNWFGTTPSEVKFIKRMEHKHNRRVGKRESYHAQTE